jgi:hypothetical protein
LWFKLVVLFKWVVEWDDVDLHMAIEIGDEYPGNMAMVTAE